MIHQVFVGAVPFTVMTLNEAINLVVDKANAHRASDNSGVAIHFCNAYNVALARSDKDYADLISHGDFVFSDGVPITWVGRRARPDLATQWERVYGPDVMEGVFARSTETGPRHYLLGSSPEVLAELHVQLNRRFPAAQLVGSESPPFRPATSRELQERDQRIRASGATAVWVGLGTPKQDREVARLASSLPVVAMAVGAAFDFLAETKPQAPLWMQHSGIEWLFRLASEPRRLWKRYLWGNSVFVAESIRTLRAKP